MINRVTIVGRITRDPELRESVHQKKFVGFTVVVDSRGDMSPNYISCYAWNKTAENMVKFLQKGAMVGVDGTLRSRAVKRQDGSNATELFVNALQVVFLEPKRNKNQESSASTESTNVQTKTNATNNNGSVNSGKIKADDSNDEEITWS